MLPIRRFNVYNGNTEYKPVYGTSYYIDSDKILSVRMGDEKIAVFLVYTHFTTTKVEKEVATFSYP